MAGLLDSDWVKFLAAPRAYYRDKQAAASAQQFAGLLGTLGEQQGPTQPGAGLLTQRAPDTQFWLKAATIPGYEGLAGQQLGYDTQQRGAMERQTQAQGWEASNMTLAQRAQQQLAEWRAQASDAIDRANLARQWAGTNAQIGASGAAQQLSQARLLGVNLDNQQKQTQATGGLFARLTPKDQLATIQDLQSKDTWATAATDVANWAEKRGKGAAIPLAGTAQADAWNTEWQSSVKPAFMQILNTGVLQGKEAEEIQQIIGQPADAVLTQSQLNVIKTAAQKVRDLRVNAYKAVGLEAPELKPGGSAAARSLSAGQPVGPVEPVTAIPGAAQPGWRPPVDPNERRPGLLRYGR